MQEALVIGRGCADADLSLGMEEATFHDAYRWRWDMMSKRTFYCLVDN